MTREELIQSIEKHIAETESNLKVTRQALTLLRGRVVGKLKDGPIVYGNGHGGARKNKPSKVAGITVPVIREALAGIIKQYPQGITTPEMRNKLNAQGFRLTPHSIHNALRGLDVNRPAGTGTKKLYSLRTNA